MRAPEVSTLADGKYWRAAPALDTAADMTTGCAFKIEDPSLGPGRVHFTAPDEGFGLEGTPKPKIQRYPSPQKRKPYMWAAAVFAIGLACFTICRGICSQTVLKERLDVPTF